MAEPVFLLIDLVIKAPGGRPSRVGFVSLWLLGIIESIDPTLPSIGETSSGPAKGAKPGTIRSSSWPTRWGPRLGGARRYAVPVGFYSVEFYAVGSKRQKLHSARAIIQLLEVCLNPASHHPRIPV